MRRFFRSAEDGIALLLVIVAVVLERAPAGIGTEWAGGLAPGFGLLAFVLLMTYLWRQVHRRTAVE